ncbi:hypothetical protein [Humibacillus xanthopallidus]|uniref:hypothetical protein n=1 Tax=Humibacillus xanthopallidus TaxID=412689 RepID=UPI00384B0CE4
MTQHPHTPSGTSFDETDATTLSQHAAYDDSTSVTSATPTGVSEPVEPFSGTMPEAGLPEYSTGNGAASTSDRDEAASVTSDAAQSGRQVADTAVSEAKDVVAEARSQVSTLLEQLRGEATEQASGQSDRAVKGLRSLGDELTQMASTSEQRGIATDLAGQAAERVQSVAGWLEQRQPGEVLDEVRDFARRRPGTFLAAAAVAGLIGGRLTRGLTAGSDSSKTTGAGTGSRAAVGDDLPGTPGYAARPATSVGTDPTRVDAGIDPATYTHPRPGIEGVEGVELGQGLR